MAGRIFNGSNYRYGFNGKENDNEVKGNGNQQDYGLRIYDPRIGKFLSVDPLFKQFAWNSPYAFAENGPIENLDLDGGERKSYLVSLNQNKGFQISDYTKIMEKGHGPLGAGILVYIMDDKGKSIPIFKSDTKLWKDAFAGTKVRGIVDKKWYVSTSNDIIDLKKSSSIKLSYERSNNI